MIGHPHNCEGVTLLNMRLIWKDGRSHEDLLTVVQEKGGRFGGGLSGVDEEGLAKRGHSVRNNPRLLGRSRV